MGEGTGGGVDTDVGVSGTTGTQDSSYSPPSYSSLGQSPGAMGGRPDPTPTPVVSAPRIPFNDQPISGDFFVNRLSRGLQDMGRNIFGGGTQTDDRGPSGADVGAVSVDDNQFNQGLASLSGVPDFVRIGGGTSSPTRNTGPFIPDPPTVNIDPTMAALRRGAPALMASNAAEEAVQTAVAQPKFMFDYGFGDAGSPQIDDRPRPDPNEIKNKGIIAPLRTVPAGGGDPLLFQDSRIMGMSPGAMGGSTIGPIQGPLPTDIDPTSDAAMFANLTSRPSGALAEVALPAGRPSDAVMLAAAAKNPTSQRDFSFREFLGNIFKNLGSKAKSVGAFISGLSAEKLQDYAEQFLAGGANQKASTVGMDPFAQQGMGPGPAVGGGAPSPSGLGGMAADLFASAMPAKDPCPPGFRFDPTLQQCVPIIAPNKPTDTTTTPSTTTTPAPGTSPPAAGGIANAYPFVLTPPIGTPVGNLPPVRLTT